MPEPIRSNIGIEVKVTDRCNQACFHCMNDDRRDGGRSIDSGLLVARLVEWWKGRERSPWRVQEVRMTGGEPLMDLAAVLEIARACGPLGIRSGINTNAVLLDRHAAKALREAGLALVKASFDAADQETLSRMRGPDCSFSLTLDGVRAARECGLSVVLRLTLCKHNVDQLVDCYRMAREIGAERLQVKGLVRSGRAAASDASLDRGRFREALRALAAVVEGATALPQILCCPPEDAFGLPVKVCGSLDKVYVRTNADVIICNFLPAPVPIGNLEREPLEAVLPRRRPALWRSPEGHVVLAGCPQIGSFDGSPGALGARDEVAAE